MNLQIRNEDTGMEFSEVNCPLPVLERIESAVRGKRISGLCYANGQRFNWSITKDDDVLIELDDECGRALDRIPIARKAWEEFVALSQRRGVDEKEWLAVLMAQGQRDGIELRQFAKFLFPREQKEYFVGPSPEVERFTDAQKRFHGGEA